MPMIITNTDRELCEKRRIERIQFSKRLKALLRQRKIRQSDLARKIWNTVNYNKAGHELVYGRDAVSAWVNGKRGITPINMDLLCKALRVSPNDLWPGYDPVENADEILDKLKVPKPVAPFKVVKKPDGRFKIEEVRIDLNDSEFLRVMSAFGSIMEKRQGRKTLEVRKR